MKTFFLRHFWWPIKYYKLRRNPPVIQVTPPLYVKGKKYYLEGDLFAKSKGVEGYAQIPHYFDKRHYELLNKIASDGVRHEDENGKVYYVIP